MAVVNFYNNEMATFGNGCFWCAEAVFQSVEGVESVISGYSGGFTKHPTYEEVCDRNTGHAQCLRIVYNPQEISYDDLLEIFWSTHDPTSLNRQGNYVGPQYRSVIFYHNEEQKEKAKIFKKKLGESGVFDAPIVTAIEPLSEFYPAEDYHSNYYLRNPTESYCHFVIKPKVEKIKRVFSRKLKAV